MLMNNFNKMDNKMNFTKNLSVIIPCYNHEKYIEETIQSIWRQNIKNMEIIVVDDGSSDNSFSLLQQLQKKSTIDMQIYTQKNQGVTKTLNRALNFASGKYICMIDSDDKYEDNALKPMIKEIESDKNLKLVYANGYGFNEKGKGNIPIHPQHIIQLLSKNATDIKNDLLVHVPRPLLTQACIMDTQMLLDFGGWDEEVRIDDWTLNINMFTYLSENHFKHKYLEHSMVLYRDHDLQMHKNSDYNFEIIKEVIYKYTPKDKKPKFLSSEMRHRAKDLLRDGDTQKANQILLEAIKTDKSFGNIFESLRLMIKYNIKSFFSSGQ